MKIWSAQDMAARRDELRQDSVIKFHPPYSICRCPFNYWKYPHFAPSENEVCNILR